MIESYCRANDVRMLNGDLINAPELRRRGYFSFNDLKGRFGIKNSALYDLMDHCNARAKINGMSVPKDRQAGVVLRLSAGPEGSDEHYNYRVFYSPQAIEQMEGSLQSGAISLTQGSPKTTSRASNSNHYQDDAWQLPPRLAIFDTETTGTGNRDSIVSFAYMVVDLNARQVLRSEELFCDPQLPQEQWWRYRKYVLPITNILLPGMKGCEVDKFMHKTAFADRLEALFREQTNFLGQNVSFDKRMIKQLYGQVGQPNISDTLGTSWYCSLQAARKLVPDPEGQGHSLDALCDRFGIDRASRVHHGALLDVELTAELIFRWVDAGIIRVNHTELHTDHSPGLC